MATASESTDMGIGLTLLFGAIAVLGAGVMAIGAPDEIAAWGFAAAVVFACLAIVSVHVFWSA